MAYSKCYCQSDIVDQLSLNKSALKINEQKGGFENISSKEYNDVRRYRFKNKNVTLTYIENNYSSECDSFIVYGKRFGVEGKFEDNLACNLDVTSLRVFSFFFKGRKYILVESIKKASGIASSYIIFHLFDVTNKSNIVYFPAWSVYGSKSCFGDFNNDGILDFLAIRPIRETVDYGTYKATPLAN